ncbi:hypothetical protein [Alloscardovia macacae]|nr:hypothetical protein [Alloscardovia macacae]
MKTPYLATSIACAITAGICAITAPTVAIFFAVATVAFILLGQRSKK